MSALASLSQLDRLGFECISAGNRASCIGGRNQEIVQRHAEADFLVAASNDGVNKTISILEPNGLRKKQLSIRHNDSPPRRGEDEPVTVGKAMLFKKLTRQGSVPASSSTKKLRAFSSENCGGTAA